MTVLRLDSFMALLRRFTDNGTPRRRFMLRLSVAVIVMVVPITVFVLYGRQHNPQPATMPAVTAAPAVAGGHDMDLGVMIERLSARLQREPGDAEGWVLLGRSYQETGQYAQAVAAYTRAAKLLPQDATVLADLVDATVSAGGRKWTDAARTMLAAALKADPAHQKALWLAGTERLDSGDVRAAEKYWQRLARVAPAGSDMAREVEANLQQLRAPGGGMRNVPVSVPVDSTQAALRDPDGSRVRIPPDAAELRAIIKRTAP
jgi:cytochrome c-type biogenesis protein CcmH